MVNLFDSANYPTAEPSEVVAGDQWAWKRPDLASIYPASDYSLSYSVNSESSIAHSFAMAATGDEYTILETSTASRAPSDYRWEAYITRTADGLRIKVAAGSLVVTHDISAGGRDIRSHAKIVLDAVEAVIEGTATNKQRSMSIAGRAMELRSYDELKQMRSDYRSEVSREKKEEQKKQGTGGSSKILTRFSV